MHRYMYNTSYMYVYVYVYVYVYLHVHVYSYVHVYSLYDPLIKRTSGGVRYGSYNMHTRFSYRASRDVRLISGSYNEYTCTYECA